MKPIPYDSTNKEFCIAPWVTLYTTANNGVSPCCVYDKPADTLKTNSIHEAWNLEGIKKIRKAMQNGESLPQCKKSCLSLEQVGHKSMRQKMNELFPNEEKVLDQTIQGHSPLNLKYFDMRLNNLCNFKCRFCGFGLSSSWYDDLAARYGDDFTFPYDSHNNPKKVTPEHKVLRNKIDLDQIKKYVLPNAEYLTFLGGEPLIDTETYEILEHLIEINRVDIPILITTNMSTLSLKGKNLTDILPKLNNVKITASLDGLGPKAEYMRKGTHWETIQKNLFQLIKLQNDLGKNKLSLGIIHTVYALNLLHSPETYSYLEEIFSHEDIRLNMCYSPEHFQIQALPKKLKCDALILYERLNSSFYNPIINILKKSIDEHSQAEDELFEVLKRELYVFDKIRAENFTDIFPEFKPYWN